VSNHLFLENEANVSCNYDLNLIPLKRFVWIGVH